jgi:hypothetical protein
MESLSETDAMVNIVTPCSSLHQILNYRLFPICQFTDEVGNMQRLLKSTLQLHLRRLPRFSPELPEANATLVTQQIYILWHMSCSIFHSQDHVLSAAVSGLGHPRVVMRNIGFLTWNKAICDQIHIFYFAWNVMWLKYATKLTSHLN